MPVRKEITIKTETRIIATMEEKGPCCPLPWMLDGPPPFHYCCLECECTFEMPAPKGPTDERNRACPQCGSKDIERIDPDTGSACPPGG